MTYNKPEVVKLDSAVESIQGVNKPSQQAFDIRTQQVLAATSAAYESDE